MHQVLLSLENMAFSSWLRESGSIWAYPTVLTAHTLGMAILVGANAALDLRLLGVAPQMPLNAMAVVFRPFWLGVALSAITGVMLFFADATTKGTTTVFFVKLVFIAIALIVARIQKRDLFGEGPAATVVSARVKILAAASLVLWVGAITAGRFMAYLTQGPPQQ